MEATVSKPSSVRTFPLGELSRDQTFLIRAFAVFLMVLCHVLDSGLPGWHWMAGDFDVAARLAKTAGLCVPIFAFLSGYGMSFAYAKEGGLGKNYLNTLVRILKFLVSYWFIFLVFFLPFVIASGSFTWSNFALSLIGWDGYVPFSWYVWFYVLALLGLPLLHLVLDKNKWLALVLSYVPLLLVYLLLAWKFQSWGYYDITARSLHIFICMLVGYSFGRHHLFTYFASLLRKRWILDLVCGILLLGLLALYFWRLLGVLYCFILIPLMFLLNALTSHPWPKWLSLPLGFFGKASMEYWFLHGFFFSSQVFAVFPSSAIVSWAYDSLLITLVILLVCTPFAWGINRLQKLVFDKKSHPVFK
jgi:hypothetical protein